MTMTHTAETVAECDEAIANLRAAMRTANECKRVVLESFIDSALDRRLELSGQ